MLYIFKLKKNQGVLWFTLNTQKLFLFTYLLFINLLIDLKMN